MECCQKRQFSLALIAFVVVLPLITVPAGARSRMRFRTAAEPQEADCGVVLDYRGGKCRNYHAEVSKSCECFSDYEDGRGRDIPARCQKFVCDSSKPKCLSDPDEASSVCSACEHPVTGKDHSCVRDGSCHQLTQSLFCCNDGFRAERNECVDIDECTEHKNICPDICENHFGTYSCHCRDGYTEVNEKCERDNSCSSLKCAHTCIPSPNGARCDCRRGYIVNGTQCHKQFVSCTVGYQLDSITNSCRAAGEEPQLVFVDGESTEVYGMYIHRNDSISKLDRIGSTVRALTYDAERHLAYLVGAELTAINYNGTEPVRKNISLNHTGLAVTYDWRGRGLYILDDNFVSYWNVSTETPRFETELYEHDGKIRDLVVEPYTNQLIWASHGFVFKADLQLRHSSKIFDVYQHIQSEVVHIERLAIDSTQLYDPFIFYAVNRSLFSFDLYGSRIDHLTASLPGPVLAMDVFEDTVYMLLEGFDGIYTRRKMEPTVIGTHLSGQNIRAFYVNHPARQESYNWECRMPCDQLCFRLTNLQPVCGCRKGFRLRQNRRSCDLIPPPEVTHVAEEKTRPEKTHREYEDVVVQQAVTGGSHQPYRAEESPSGSGSLVPLFMGFGLLILIALCVGQGYLLFMLLPRHHFSNGVSARFATQRDTISIMNLTDNERM